MKIAIICALASAAAAETLTTYRITPLNYTGLTDMDSGDAAGDAFFGLFELVFPILCRDDPTFLDCRDVPILDIPGFNVYTQFTLETDEHRGPYALCNPNEDNGRFECMGHSSHQSCWNSDPSVAERFKDVCNTSSCHCDVYSTKSVGIETCPLCDQSGGGGSLPAKCSAAGFQPYGDHCIEGSPTIIVPNSTVADCCAAASQDSTVHDWTLTPDNTCKLFEHAQHTTSCKGGTTGYKSQPRSVSLQWAGKLASMLNGTWYR
jgi:hypothetical protein